MNPFAYDVRAEIEVDATPEEVWQVLADHDGYPQWHPAVAHTSGQLRVGARQREVVRTGNGRQLTFRPVLTVVEPGRQLTRRGRLLAPGVFTGAHSYLIEPAGAHRVRVVQAERLTGVLGLGLPVMRRGCAGVARRQSFLRQKT